MRRAVTLLGAAHPGPGLRGHRARRPAGGRGRPRPGRPRARGGRRAHRSAVDRLVQRPRRPAARPRGRTHRQAAGDGRARRRRSGCACASRPAAHGAAVPALRPGAPGSVHLVSVASGWAYNLGLKSTAWSWAPYAVAFGALPAVVSLADDPRLPPRLVPSPVRCWASARTSSTCCPTSPTTRPPGCAGCRTGSAPATGRRPGRAVLVAATVVDRARCARSTRRGRRRRRWSSWAALAVVALVGARQDAVPGCDRDRAGRRRPAGVGRESPRRRHRPAGTSSSSAPARPGPPTALGALQPTRALRVLLLDRVRLPARQVLRRRDRPARASTGSSRSGSPGVEDGWTPLTRLELARGDLVGGPADGPAGLRRSRAAGLRRAAGRAARWRAPAPPARVGSSTSGHGPGSCSTAGSGHGSWSGPTAPTERPPATSGCARRPPGAGDPRLRPDAPGPRAAPR